MASNETLVTLYPADNEPPGSLYATRGTRNGHPTLQFLNGVAWIAIFSFVMPRNYAGGGVTVYVHSSAVPTSGTVGWLAAFERVGTAQDIDSDNFASNQTITAAAVSGTSGIVTIGNVAFTNGAQMASIAVGELARLRITRNGTVDTAAGNAELVCVEIKET